MFWRVVEICSRMSIPVKEMLVCPPPPGKEMALRFCIIAPRGHSITKDMGDWLKGLSQKSQNIYPKIAIF